MTDESQSPLLVLDKVEEFLDSHNLGSGPLRAARIGDGQSNVTYRLDRDASILVLRRGPRPPFPKSAHDMVREAHLLQALAGAGLPVPVVRAIHEGSDILGVPFYVMDYLPGEIITTEVPAALDTAGGRRSTSEALVDVLVTIHGIDWEQVGLAGFGQPEGYLQRQVARFSALWDQNTTRDLPLVAQLGDWLERHRPHSGPATVVHGDFRLGNIMFAPSVPGQLDARASVLAVLDWEMATIGDPLADLGYLVATYGEDGFDETPLELSPVTRGANFLRRDDLVRRYAEQTGRSVDDLSWYLVLALWKAAVFCEAIYTRWLRGERPHDTTFAPRLEVGVQQLLAQANRATSGPGRPRHCQG